MAAWEYPSDRWPYDVRRLGRPDRGARRRASRPVEPSAPVRSVIGWIKLEPLLAAVLWGGIYPGAKLGLREIRYLASPPSGWLSPAAFCSLCSGGTEVSMFDERPSPTWRTPGCPKG